MKICRAENQFSIVLVVLLMNIPILAQSSLDSLIQTMPQTCTSLMKQSGWPSLSIAIVLDQEIIYSRAFGFADVDKQIPATTKTIYRVASMTKLFTATMLLQLAERGKVNLNDPLIKYLPDYRPKYSPNTGPTTLRQLATHTAGLHVDAGQVFWHYLSNFQYVVSKAQEKIVWGITKDDLLSSLDKIEIEYTPNLYPHYSNLGYQLLGIALERAAQKPFETYIKSNILDPLNMRDSGFSLDVNQQARFAVGYTYLEPDFRRFQAPEWDLSILKYSGGLCSTPEDIARFISFQFQDQMENHLNVLSGDGMRLMRTPQTLRNPETEDTYGIGWAVYDYEGHPIIAHAGGHWGFSVKAGVLRDYKLGVVVMTNCNYPQGNIGPDKDITKIIISKIIPVLDKKNTEPFSDYKKVDLLKYSGSYSIPGGFAHAEVQVRNDTLQFSLFERPDFSTAILPVGFNQFCFAADPGKNPMFQFGADAQDEIVDLQFLEYSFKKNRN